MEAIDDDDDDDIVVKRSPDRVPKLSDEMQREMERLQLNIDSDEESVNPNIFFEEAKTWVSARQIYPHHHRRQLSHILNSMNKLKIVKADVLPKGTQIKLLLMLENGEKVVFKQKRYERDHIIEGKAYDGYDRHNAEIAAFHLDRLLDFRRAPLVVGRRVNVKKEILPVATQQLKDTFREKNGTLCYFGKCLYCKEAEMACTDPDYTMEGSLTLWLPSPQWTTFTKLRHPYQRTYKEGKQAQWERDEAYCNNQVKHKIPYDRGSRLLDVTDASAFDYLIGNADRHHYEVFKDVKNSMIIMLDNAKSFGNPYLHEKSILAPIRQCCILRKTTHAKLLTLRNGVLTRMLVEAMSNDPIRPILTQPHLDAMNLRLIDVLETVERCIEVKGRDNVLLDQWTGPS